MAVGMAGKPGMQRSIKEINKANQTTLLVSRPPVFIFLCGRAVIIHYSLFNIMAF